MLEYPTMPPIIDWLISWIKLVLEIGKKFLDKARAIMLIFKLSGIIKFSRSIKNIIINSKLKIDKKIIVRKLLKFMWINKKVIPVIISTIKYLKGIIFLHFLHLPLKIDKKL